MLNNIRIWQWTGNKHKTMSRVQRKSTICNNETNILRSSHSILHTSKTYETEIKLGKGIVIHENSNSYN